MKTDLGVTGRQSSTSDNFKLCNGTEPGWWSMGCFGGAWRMRPEVVKNTGDAHAHEHDEPQSHQPFRGQ